MRGMGQMPNMQNMMKQVQRMQKQMQADQEKLTTTTFTGKAANDMVTVKFNGDRQMKDIAIKPEAVDPDDVEMLQDLILMAVNDAMQQIDQQTQQALGQYANKLR